MFTTFVVSPALKAMKWGEAERERAAIGRRYTLVGSTNLSFLAIFAFIDGVLGRFGALLYAECVLILAQFGLVAAHGAVFGRRLVGLAEAELGAETAEEAVPFARRHLQQLSLKVSWVNPVVSVAVTASAVTA